uniref:Uncharacterized protein n=1 Tax=Triticum urartu TaxID=4572 RepID=A0A8R7U838_TRIUA
MASSPLLLLFLLVLALACTCRASSGHAVEVDPTCPPAKASAVAVQASDYGGPRCQPPAPHVPVPVFLYDVNPMQFTLNLEYTEAEFFLHAAFGKGLDAQPDIVCVCRHESQPRRGDMAHRRGVWSLRGRTPEGHPEHSGWVP